MPRGVHNSPRSFNTVDMVGRTFSFLTAVERAGTSPDRKAIWRCRCVCGGWTVATGKALRNGHTRSCGCLITDVLVRRNTTHGTSGTRLYRIWKDMHKRCRHHPHYADRDITVDPIWATYPPFRDWSLANGYRDDLTIDRKDTNAGYAPDNCRWATRKQQSENRYDRIGGYTPVP